MATTVKQSVDRPGLQRPPLVAVCGHRLELQQQPLATGLVTVLHYSSSLWCQSQDVVPVCSSSPGLLGDMVVLRWHSARPGATSSLHLGLLLETAIAPTQDYCQIFLQAKTGLAAFVHF